MSVHEGANHTQCSTFIDNKQPRITLSKRILDELTSLNHRRTTRINSLVLSSLVKRKGLPINQLNVLDVLDEVDSIPPLSKNDELYIEELLFYCKNKLDPTKPVSELITEFRRAIQTSAKQFIYLKASFSPRQFTLYSTLVTLLFSITNNKDDAEHLSDAFQWNLEHVDNKHFVTHDVTDLLSKSHHIVKEMKKHNPKSALEISRVRHVSQL